MSKKVLAALLAVCMVASLLFVPAAAATFNDVDEDHWASGAIERWAGYGVLNGKDAEAGIFDPSAPMTRAEFAKMLVEMLGLTDKADIAFDDVKADAWYAEVVAIAVKAGIINGRTTEKFEPNEPVTFQEAAVMMCRAFGLAKNTGGTDWAKESIEKLTSLGMIGEGADEHLQVGVDCDRAVVAALADAVVKEYVNEDREEPITGEVNGVVLVVKGAKVEIKDATVSAPIVVESAEVTLTGTKAEDVKVSGKDAAIAADEASTVASVTLAGEAPKADIKGEVASVTIAEETTGAVVDAPKADPDTIVNNSTEEATVNGETVEGKPAETTDPTEPEGPGSVNGNDGPEAPPREPTTPGEASPDHTHAYKTPTSIDNKSHKKVCDCGDVVIETHTFTANAEGKKVCACGLEEPTTKTEEPDGECTGTGATGGAHDFNDANPVVVAPTCTKDGTTTYACQHEGCNEKKVVTTPATGHTFGNGEVTKAATCLAEGERTYTCACGEKKVETIGKANHDYTGETKFNSTHHWKLCKTEGCNATGTPVEHSLGAPVTEGNDCTKGITKTEACTGCDYEKVTTVKNAKHTWTDADEADTACTTPGCTQTKPATTEPDPDEPTSHTCEHPKGKYTPAGDGKSCSHTCTVSDQGTHSKETDTQTHTSGSECEYCGKTFYAPTEGTGNWTETDPNAVDAGSR